MRLSSGEFHHFTGGIEFAEDWHWMSGSGFRLPVDSAANSSMWYWSNHVVDYLIGLAPENEPFEQASVRFERGDRLLMYSDGLPDAMSSEVDVFGAARLIETVTRLRSRPLDNMVHALIDEIDE